MLSEHEQRELRHIEQVLLSDRRLSAAFSSAKPGRRRRPRLHRVLVVLGVSAMVAGAFLDRGDVVVQGFVLFSAGLVQWVWADSSSPSRRGGRRSGQRN